MNKYLFLIKNLKTKSWIKYWLSQVKTSGLPDDYQEVEYLETTGTQYIDTGILPSASPKFEITWSPTKTGSNYLCGARTTDNNLWCGVMGGSSGNTINSTIARTDVGNLYYSFDMNRKLNKWYKNISDIEYDETNGYRGKFTLKNLTEDTEEIGYSNYINSSFITEDTQSLLLFAVRPLSNNRHPGVKISSYKYYANYTDTQPTLNLIPCYRKSDNKPGMYDTVNGVFYTNAGPGEFITGDEV